MPEAKDLTEALAAWDKRRAEPEIPSPYDTAGGNELPERKLNPDIFGAWVYLLLFLTLIIQLGVLASLDIIG